MPRKRIRLLLHVLNKYQVALTNMELPDARRYFDKISAAPRLPRVFRITEHLIGNDKQLAVRVYHAKKSNAPVMLFFHGGGWMLGSLASHDAVARQLCRRTGCTLVSVAYRLAPEHPFPAASQDGLTALSWLRQQETFKDKAICLVGDSAGGQVALYTYILASQALQRHIQALILIYPSLDPALQTDSMQRYAERYFVTKANARTFWKNYLNGHTLQWPLPAENLATLPPTLVQTADFDILKDEGRLFAEAITKAGGDSEYHSYTETTHGFMQMPSLINKRRTALRDMVRFLARTKKPQD